jgi:spermidine synthase
MALAALLPALLADRVESAFVIGYGTGVTVGELASFESSREVVVAEISSGVIEAAPLFDSGNQNASTNPKVRIVRTDAYRALVRSAKRYDAIISEPSNPWVTGVEMLFSREFLDVAHSRLQPGGVYLQWLHTYETDEATLSLISRTFASIFPSRAIWYSNTADILIAGFRDPPGSDQLDRLLARASQPDYRAALERAGISSIPALLAHELIPLGADVAQPGPLHSLLHPILSDQAARAFFPGKIAVFPRALSAEASRAGATNSLLAQYTRQRGRPLSQIDRMQFVQETCESMVSECITLLASWQRDEPDSPALAHTIERSLMRSRLRAELSPQRLLELSALFDPSSPPSWPDDGETPAVQAARAAEIYVAYYHHAEPFRRDVLDAMLDRCDTDATPEAERKECRRLRVEVESRVGDLDPVLEHPALQN